MGISNLLLLQTLTPKYALSFNNLSWYLSVTLFCYMFSKSLIKLINKLKINEVTLIIYMGNSNSISNNTTIIFGKL